MKLKISYQKHGCFDYYDFFCACARLLDYTTPLQKTRMFQFYICVHKQVKHRELY